jgi:dTDP-4-dehydrorhamnose reductase
MFLLIGGDSEIGTATIHHLAEHSMPMLATTRRPERVGGSIELLDLSRPLNHWEPPASASAACIFAAVSRLGACATDPQASAFINVEQTLVLAKRLLARGIYVLFLSTNQVFDGSVTKIGADAPTCPVSEYGRQKARTEAALRQHMDRGAPVGILRLAKVVSPNMKLMHGWIDALRADRSIRAFHDMRMAPSPTEMVVRAIAQLLRDKACGIFQLSGPRDVSYLEIGYHLAERVGAATARVEGISAIEAGQPVGATPCHTTLDSSALREHYGLIVPDVWVVLEAPILQSSAPNRSAPEAADRLVQR